MYMTYYCVRGMWGCTEQQTNRREKLKAHPAVSEPHSQLVIKPFLMHNKLLICTLLIKTYI